MREPSTLASEVPQVGVAEDVLLAGDLGAAISSEQTLGAAGDLGHVDGPLRRLDPGVEFLDVGDELVGDGSTVGLKSGDP